jgi:hypothetical protein
VNRNISRNQSLLILSVPFLPSNREYIPLIRKSLPAVTQPHREPIFPRKKLGKISVTTGNPGRITYNIPYQSWLSWGIFFLYSSSSLPSFFIEEGEKKISEKMELVSKKRMHRNLGIFQKKVAETWATLTRRLSV